MRLHAAVANRRLICLPAYLSSLTPLHCLPLHTSRPQRVHACRGRTAEPFLPSSYIVLPFVLHEPASPPPPALFSFSCTSHSRFAAAWQKTCLLPVYNMPAFAALFTGQNKLSASLGSTFLVWMFCSHSGMQTYLYPCCEKNSFILLVCWHFALHSHSHWWWVRAHFSFSPFHTFKIYKLTLLFLVN